MQPAIIIAIDGPAGAGKSSIAAQVASVLQMTRVDTGAIYRAATLISLERGLTDAQIPALLEGFPLKFVGEQVLVGDRDVSEDIRSSQVSASTSRVSALPDVRAGLLELQRRLGRDAQNGAVMEGRDIGTVVFPDAEVKVFLTASVQERALRRLKDLKASGETIDLEEVQNAIEQRDAQDSNRAAAPLRASEDSTLVDSTGKTPDEVVAEIVALVRRAFPVASGPSQV